MKLVCLIRGHDWYRLGTISAVEPTPWAWLLTGKDVHRCQRCGVAYLGDP